MGIKGIPFLAFPPGLGGAMAMTVRNLGVEERSEDGFLLKNWREIFELDKLMDEGNIEEESLPLSTFFKGTREVVDREEAIEAVKD